MSKPTPDPAEDRVTSRAEALTAEERHGGVDDPEATAEAVLADSDARQLNREGTASEHRRSEDTVEPTD